MPQIIAKVLFVASVFHAFTGIGHSLIALELKNDQATGADWASASFEEHQEWAHKWAGGGINGHLVSATLLETCLDHITTDENGNVPRRVSKTGLLTLTFWCREKMDTIKTNPVPQIEFKYPD